MLTVRGNTKSCGHENGRKELGYTYLERTPLHVRVLQNKREREKYINMPFLAIASVDILVQESGRGQKVIGTVDIGFLH